MSAPSALALAKARDRLRLRRNGRAVDPQSVGNQVAHRAHADVQIGEVLRQLGKLALGQRGDIPQRKLQTVEADSGDFRHRVQRRFQSDANHGASSYMPRMSTVFGEKVK